MKKVSKSEAQKLIEEFFKDLKNKTAKDIGKIKRLAMSHNIKLGSKRKKFCRRCFSPELKTISVKNKIKKVKCRQCGTESRWKIK